MVETMFAASAASCWPVKAMHFAVPDVAEVSLRWAICGGGAGRFGGVWDFSTGQVTAPECQARRVEKRNSGPLPVGKTSAPLRSLRLKFRSVSCDNSRKVHERPLERSTRARSLEKVRAVASHCS